VEVEEYPLEYVERDVGSCVSEVRGVVDGGTAGVPREAFGWGGGGVGGGGGGEWDLAVGLGEGVEER